jgi:hypothetical protein
VNTKWVGGVERGVRDKEWVRKRNGAWVSYVDGVRGGGGWFEDCPKDLRR